MNIKWLLLQNYQNADTTLLHSHDEIILSTTGHKKNTLLIFDNESTEISNFINIITLYIYICQNCAIIFS